MAKFGFGKGKDDRAVSDQVLAYLEEALAARSPFTVKLDQRETAALLHSVNEEARSFRLLPRDDLPVAKGGRLAFTLIHDGLRLGASARVVEARAGILALQLPDALELMERRGAPRARLNPKEQATLTALQDLFEGVGIFGAVENVSEAGARIRVEKAVAIGSEKRLVLGSNLVPAGQKFMVVKLNKVPRCPAVLETEGRAVYLAADASGLALGIAFTKPAAPVAAALRNLVGQRCPPTPVQLPAKLRRRPEPREEPTRPIAARELPPVERRSCPRLTLGAGFHARFMVGDELFPAADLLDLSAGGCCLRLPLDLCGEVQRGAGLDEFHFLHRDLPKGVLKGSVKWVLGRNPGTMESGGAGRYCLVGVEFRDIPEALGQAIAAYVDRLHAGGAERP